MIGDSIYNEEEAEIVVNLALYIQVRTESVA